MVIELEENNFKKEVEESKIPVIIDFFADWCGPCQMMKPVFEKISKEYEGKLKFAKINTEDSPQLAEKFGIQGIPCLIIAKKGKEVDRIVGFMSEASLKQNINEILKNI
ncbi:MAG: thioredoxin [Candidatus Pacearchaeota archaeon]|jgi:thioredoxin 1